MKRKNILISWLLCLLFLNSCTTPGPAGLFGKRSPHEQYGQKLTNAGLKETALGRSWFTAAEQSLNNPLTITIPHKETGYFPAEKAIASAIRFEVKRGEKLTVSLKKIPAKNFTIYVDLWEVKNNNNKKLVAYADTDGNAFNQEIDDSGFYIIRLQPELLGSGEYTLTINTGPSLAFPIKNGKIGSFWGADRDGGARKHEGVDIFAPKRTPVLAAANGTISRVTINQLGGKVIFMRPAGKDYSLYYAHLDEQLVSAGQEVQTGDTIGLVGNTGNAISTSPHLHFGIYTFGGAIDPLAFVNPITKPAPEVKASLSNLGKSMRTGSGTVSLRKGPSRESEIVATLNSNTLLEVHSATDQSYRVLVPNGSYGYINSTAVNPISRALKQIRLPLEKPLFDNPDNKAAKKTQLLAGSSISVLGNYENFYFVEAGDNSGWVERD